MTARGKRQRGVSLVEALVAMAVMAVGLLGVVGMQATLRTNADVSRQRSEAVRLAQAEIERLRGFMLLDGAASGELDFADIASTTTPDVFTPGSTFVANAIFRRSVTVTAVPSNGPQMKTVKVEVKWWDRRADSTDINDTNAQSIVLQTSVAKQPPELGAGLGIPTTRSATQRPRRRNIAIPRAAVDSSGGTTSTYTPAGGGGVAWVFNNDSAMITRIGTKTVSAVYISGYLRFATGTSPPPTAAESEAPPDNGMDGGQLIVPAGGGFDGAGVTLDPTAAAGGIEVRTTLPVLYGTDFTGGCVVSLPFTSGGQTYQAFDCAVPTQGTGLGGPFEASWTGSLHVKPRPGLAETGSPASNDNAATHYRVCRYTPYPGTSTLNAAHPASYTGLAGALNNQNYLLIRAGNGSGAAFTCPVDDGTITPQVDSNTAY